MKLPDAMDRYAATGEPQPIAAGRCEKRVSSGSRGPYGIPTGYCGKPGRWYDGEFRCGEHKRDA